MSEMTINYHYPSRRRTMTDSMDRDGNKLLKISTRNGAYDSKNRLSPCQWLVRQKSIAEKRSLTDVHKVVRLQTRCRIASLPWRTGDQSKQSVQKNGILRNIPHEALHQRQRSVIEEGAPTKLRHHGALNYFYDKTSGMTFDYLNNSITGHATIDTKFQCHHIARNTRSPK